MKLNSKIKVYCISLLSLFFLGSCNLSTWDLEEEVKDSVTEKLAGTGVYVTDLTLVHQSGNDYTGTITLSAEGEELELDINVICDGRSFQYEIPDLNNYNLLFQLLDNL